MTTQVLSIMEEEKKTGAFTGYKDGIRALIKEANVTNSCFLRKAINHNVLHVGGPNSFGQYKYTKFMHPIVQRAVDGGASQLVYMVTEGSQSTSKKIPCAALVGDYDNVVQYIGSQLITKRPHLGVYYYHFNPLVSGPHKVKAFLDFDIVLPNDKPWEESWSDHVLKAIDIVNAAFEINADLQAEEHAADLPEFNLEYLVAYGSRPVNVGFTKHSYHVTWKFQGFDSQQDQCNFMHSQLDEHGINYDSKVYSNGRLMRAPWCGKAGVANAKLLPTVFTPDPITGEWTKKVTSEQFDSDLFKQFNITPYNWDMKNIRFHTCRLAKNQYNINRVGLVARQTAVVDLDGPDPRFVFFEPLLHTEILPKIQAHRRAMLTAIQANGVAVDAGVPVANYKTTNWEKSSKFAGQYLIKVVGDTFCEYDRDGETPFYHRTEKIKIAVDLQHGTYKQLCYTCNPRAYESYGIFKPNRVEIGEYTASTPRVLDIMKKKGTPLVLKYFADDIMFNPTTNAEFVVYDSKMKLWCAEKHSMYMMLRKAATFQDRYRAYRVAVWQGNFEYRLSQCNGDEKKIERLKKEKIALEAIDVLPVGPEQIIKEMKGSYVHVFGGFSTTKMNHCKHLVPMNDGTCYNVLTDTIVPRTKEMHFTSQLADVIKSNTRDEECRMVKEWFLEVAKGREDLALYKKRLFGLVMTALKIDRHFYILLGVLGRNGKSTLFEFLEVCNFSLSLIFLTVTFFENVICYYINVYLVFLV